MIPLWEVDMVVTYRTLQGIFQGIKGIELNTL